MLPLVCYGQHRGKDDAIDIAKEFCSVHLPSVSGVGSKIKSSSDIKSNVLPSQSKDAFYILQGQNKGFVIISGDERMPKVLAYSDSSDFDVDNMPPAVRYWLDCYEEYYCSLENIGNTMFQSVKTDIYPDGVSPLLDKIQWGQGSPFNRYCPTVDGEITVTGCVATAMAQVMKYHEYPQRGYGKCDYFTSTNHVRVTRDLSQDVFDWDNMLPDYNHSYTEVNAKAVAVLMASCGASVRMDYGTNSQGGSGAYQTDLLSSYVENYGYDPDAAVLIRAYCSTGDWHDILINELNEGRPVNYAGHSTRDGGHSFVLDGYRVRNEVKYPDYHVNWGWNGSCDGYYQISDLQAKENGQVATFDGFNSNQQMTIKIRPNDGIDERYICLGTDKLKSSVSDCKAGDKIKITTSSICNLGYHPFSGTIYVNLVYEDGRLKELAKTRHISLKSLEEYKSLSVDAVLPEDLEDGIYTVQLYIEDGYGNQSKVYSKSYPQIAVSANGDISVPPSYISSTVGCSDIQFLTNRSDNSEIRVKIYEFINLEEAPFIGDVRLLISDEKGLGYTSLGDSVVINEIGQYEVVSDPIALKCKISGDWPDGHYRIYIGARPLGTMDYNYVSFYDYTEPAPIAKEQYFDAIIESGQIRICNNSYDIVPVSISIPVPEQEEQNSYEVDGRTYRQLNHSLQILISNGRKMLKGNVFK